MAPMAQLEMEFDAEEDYDSEEEELELIRSRRMRGNNNSSSSKPAKPRSLTVVVVTATLVIIALWAAAQWNGDEVSPNVSSKKKNPSSTALKCKKDLRKPIVTQPNENNGGILQFECPCSIDRPAANIAGEEKMRYREQSKKVMKDLSSYLNVFRDSQFDDWGHSYREVKKGMADWKKRYFSELKDNSTIYESACGTGMNLFMTLEILHELKGTKNLVVYGNEYVRESVRVANEIARRGALPAGGRLGTICQGDSTDLKHVPSSSFDLVYTGYIAPLVDPLGLNQGTDENFAVYTALCEKDDEESVQMRRDAQKQQNRWYADWVKEMVRIARPGAPIIVEQVSYPLCEATFDWGGVNQQFWGDMVQKRNLDVDVDSIQFEDDHIFRKRYHVFMRKNG